MRSAIFRITDTDLIEEANQVFKKHGWEIGCQSNAGLFPGLIRITWFPPSAFKKDENI